MSIILIPSCSKCTFISSTHNKENFSESEAVFVGTSFGEPATTFRTLLKFDTKVLAKNGQIASAKLKLFVKRNDCPDEQKVMDIHRLSESFEEKEVTWKNQPKFDPAIVASAKICQEIDRFVSWDITYLLRGWQSKAEKNRGIVLVARNENRGCLVSFDSNKYLLGERRPHISVTLSGREQPPNRKSRGFFSNVQRDLQTSENLHHSQTYNISKATFATFFVQNKGNHPANLKVETNHDHDYPNWLTEDFGQVINPGANLAIPAPPQAQWARLAYQSTIPEEPTTLDIWIQIET